MTAQPGSQRRGASAPARRTATPCRAEPLPERAPSTAPDPSASSDPFDAARFLLAHFDRLAEAPGALAKLRALILQLAVRGNFSILGEIAKTSDARPYADPFAIPPGWSWVTIRDICESSFYGPRFGKEEYDDSGIPTIRTTDMTDDGRIVLKSPPRVRVPTVRLDDFKCLNGDLLITRTGSIGIMAIFEGDYLAIPSAYLIRFRFTKLASPKFVQLVLRSPYGISQLGLGTTKVAQPNINSETIKTIAFPLPPIAEQRRIVTTVEELMSLCDALEAAQRDRAKIAEQLLNATIARLSK